MEILLLFSVCAGGLALGRLQWRGIGAGTSAVLFTAIAAGVLLPQVRPPGWSTSVGILLFVSSVGTCAAPMLVQAVRRCGARLLLPPLAATLGGAAAALAAVRIGGIPAAQAAGLLAGALTTTPGLSAALEHSTDKEATLLGYGLAYPFGVAAVVAAMHAAARLIATDEEGSGEGGGMAPASPSPLCGPDTAAAPARKGADGGTASIPAQVESVAWLLALAAAFSLSPLGSTLGALLAGMCHSWISRRPDAIVPPMNEQSASAARTVGLALFLAGVGLKAGPRLLAYTAADGAKAAAWGAVMTCCALACAWWAVRMFNANMDIVEAMGVVSGSMTSTPGVGTAVEAAGSEVPAATYALVYPFALLSVMPACSWIAAL